MSELAGSAPAVPEAESASLPRLSQYGHSVWRTQDGLFSSPNGIAQSKDGYLWIGTDAGLVRFDGVRFLAWKTLADAAFAGRKMGSVLAAADGTLWVASGSQVVGWRAGRSFRYEVAGLVTQLAEDAKGAIWIAQIRTGGRGGPLCRVTNGALECFAISDVPLPFVNSVVANDDGSLWLGSSYGLCRWTPGQAGECHLADRLKSQANLIGVTAIQRTKDGTLWIGIGKAGHDLGLGQFADGRWISFAAVGLDGSTVSVSSLMEDHNGSLWVGTFDHGLYRIHRGRIEHFGLADGLSGDSVSEGGLYEDREGAVWVLTPRGLDAFRRLPVSLFSAREGLPAEGVESVLPAKDGTVWFGNLTLSILSNGRTAPAPHPELFQGRSVTSMLEDHDGRLWIGLDNTLNIFEKGVLKHITTVDGAPLGVVENIAEDTSHDVWVTTAAVDPQLFRIRHEGGEPKVVEHSAFKREPRVGRIAPDPAGGVWMGYRDGTMELHRDGKVTKIAADAVSSAPVTGLRVDADGTLLAATLKGLLIQRGESRRLLDIKHGLPCEALREVVRDRHEALWLVGDCGIIELTADKLKGWLASPTGQIQARLFDVTDGVQPGTGSFAPRASMGPDGRLWFANGKVAQVIDPTALETRKPVLPVLIEEVTADRMVFQPAESLKLPARTRDIGIRYTAISFLAPQKIEFRYRLEGRDKDWIYADTRRQAFYTDLPPGRYRFQVVAGNSDGIWNDAAAAQDFEIPPLFYQTGWFVGLCVAGVLGLLYGAFLIRLRQLDARAKDRLAAKDAERERIARDLHDTLLQSTEGLILRFQAAANRIPPGDPTRNILEKALQRADEVVAEGRDRVQDLRTSDSTLSDLPQSLAQVGHDLAKESQTRFQTLVEGTARALGPAVNGEIYRIGREALLNAFRHAEARLIEVQIIFGETDFRVRIRDDGIGMAVDAEAVSRPGHWGLQGMRERSQAIGGRFELWSGPGAGTEIELVIPAAVAYAKQSRRSRWAGALGLVGK